MRLGRIFLLNWRIALAYDFDLPSRGNAGSGPEPWKREVKFEAVPRCSEKSQYWGDTFWDASRRKCVHLNRANTTVPHSLPCPPGAGRREDEFVCRGRIETAFQIHCKHAWDVVPSKPYYANENYQCVQILVYDLRKQLRCPTDFRLKKLYDRTGYQIQYHKYICVAIAARSAHLVTFDPIIVSNCQYMDEAPWLEPEDLKVGDEDEFEDPQPQIDSERRFVKESYHNHDHLRDPETGRINTYGTGGVNARGRYTTKSMGQCTLTKTEQVVMCDYTDKLVWNNEKEHWNCVGKVYVAPDPDPTGCRKGFYWSNEFLSCIRVRAYSPERQCGDGVEGHTFAREGSPRRYSRGPRYNDYSAYTGDDGMEDDDLQIDAQDEDPKNDAQNSTTTTTAKPKKTEAATTSAPTSSTYAQEAAAVRTGPLEWPSIWEVNGRCYTDSALPETPYCPEGYFLEQYHKDQVPICIEAQYTEPMWDCRGIGWEGTPVLDNDEMICTVAWDGRLEIDGKPPPTKREFKNTWHLARKSVMNLPLYEEAADMKEQFAFGKDVHNAGKISWDSAIRAALQLLNPQDTFNPYSAPLTTDGGLVYSGLMGAQQTTT